MKRFNHNIGFGILLSMIVPGAGHIFIREYLFGVFVFLIMLIAVALFFVTFLVDLPQTILIVLFGLPALFYLFSFADLWKSASRSSADRLRSPLVVSVFLMASLAVGLLVPFSPGNFLWRNRPEIRAIHRSTVTPLVEDGDLVLVDPTAVRVKLFFLGQPIARPGLGRYDLVRFRVPGADDQIGMVLGWGGEEVAMLGDSLSVDGKPVPLLDRATTTVTGTLPLTLVDYDAILVATLNDGVVQQTFQVPRRQIIGEVHRLF